MTAIVPAYGEGLRLNHAIGASVEKIGRHCGSSGANAQKLPLRVKYSKAAKSAVAEQSGQGKRQGDGRNSDRRAASDCTSFLILNQIMQRNVLAIRTATRGYCPLDGGPNASARVDQVENARRQGANQLGVSGCLANRRPHLERDHVIRGSAGSTRWGTEMGSSSAGEAAA